MKVSIDVVPALHINYTTEHYLHPTIRKTYSLPVIPHGDGVHYSVCFSEVENDVVRSLPRQFAIGFMLAKAVRRASVLNGTPGTEDVDDYEQLVKTYYLKQALIAMTSDGFEHLRGLSETDVAVKIYNKVVFGILVVLFLPSKK